LNQRKMVFFKVTQSATAQQNINLLQPLIPSAEPRRYSIAIASILFIHAINQATSTKKQKRRTPTKHPITISPASAVKLEAKLPKSD